MPRSKLVIALAAVGAIGIIALTKTSPVDNATLAARMTADLTVVSPGVTFAELEVSNRGNEPLLITSISGSCSLDGNALIGVCLVPGERRAVPIRVTVNWYGPMPGYLDITALGQNTRLSYNSACCVVISGVSDVRVDPPRLLVKKSQDGGQNERIVHVYTFGDKDNAPPMDIHVMAEDGPLVSVTKGSASVSSTIHGVLVREQVLVVRINADADSLPHIAPVVFACGSVRASLDIEWR